MNKKQNNIYIGTSGWHYKHWKGVFYPSDTPNKEYLRYYVQHFRTAEINNSFYQIPDKKTLQNWSCEAGKDFIFSAKASRYITHMKKLKDPQEPVKNFMNKIKALGNSLGPILFQLPPRWKKNRGRLQSFLQALPSGHQYTFEFRDPDWFRDDIYELLERQKAAFCIYDFNRRQSPKIVTSGFVYIRLHGPDGAYQGKYDDQKLSGWAGAISQWKQQGKDVFCYFDNDQVGYAAENAERLQEMIGED
ncbi:MAG: DUF72 domain-containing protein [Acidobacteriota bacterium]